MGRMPEMRTIVITRHGASDVLELRDQPEPEPGPGQLLVEVKAAGVNYRDVYEREGGSAHAAPTPSICGVEGAGTVVGSGERVAWVAAPGSYAERVVLEADRRSRCRTGRRPTSPPRCCCRA